MSWFEMVIALIGIASVIMSFVLAADRSYPKHQRVEFFLAGVVLVFATVIVIVTV